MKNHINKSKMLKLWQVTLLTIMISGCSTYNSSFTCPDARGLNCLSMSMVDQRIQSGEIEEVELSNCRGKNCAKERALIKPQLKLEKTYEAVLVSDEPEAMSPVVIGDRLYVK